MLANWIPLFMTYFCFELCNLVSMFKSTEFLNSFNFTLCILYDK
ncbi:hypothetical protein LEP1GSC074_2665 [Leptospira noguchii str. Hook]|nr:hypothetical protein LEP1GSC072_3483 [Leptospira noguchii str. Bonito]EMS84212.1 hypothetical protein LEP1GSC074_2665 [Leptospira noguchii str. Hook]EMS85707.1 hypothetical protein LEP1GSC073_3074 [Leptospira noguchii str. Cascata]